MLDHLTSTGQINLVKLANSIDHDAEDELASVSDKISIRSFNEYYTFNGPKIRIDILNKMELSDTTRVRSYALKLGYMASSLPAEKIQLELQKALETSKKS